ncbi:MAG: hypothetical protein HDS53_06475 [Barnesiella sp.]|nr:hypothetical protein [Barnesiella sp.]
MSKKETTETRTKIDDLNDSLTRAELKVQNNKKLILYVGIAAVVVVLLVLGYIYLIHKPSVNKANTAYGMADNKELAFQMQSMQLDSAGRVTEMAAVTKAYEDAARNGGDGGNNATLMAAVYNFKSGQYQKALDLLKEYDRNDEIIGATSKALEGDCYVNLDKFDEAIKSFQEAAKIAKGNSTLEPYCILKEATVQRHKGNFTAEAELYKKILDTYPEYSQMTGENYEAYYQRALAQAGQK